MNKEDVHAYLDIAFLTDFVPQLVMEIKFFRMEDAFVVKVLASLMLILVEFVLKVKFQIQILKYVELAQLIKFLVEADAFVERVMAFCQEILALFVKIMADFC